MTISIEYEADKVLNLPYREIIEDTVLAALDYEGCPYEAEVNVILTDNDAIQEINREHRRIDAPTDVLSFPMVDYESPSDFDHVEEAVEDYFNPETGELMLGDIVISVDIPNCSMTELKWLLLRPEWVEEQEQVQLRS